MKSNAMNTDTVTQPDPVASITAQQRAQFDEQGYLILHGILPEVVLSGARDAMLRLVDDEARKLQAAGLITDTMQDEPFERRLFKLYEHHLASAPTQFRTELHLAELFEVFFDSSVLDVTEALLGPELRLYPNYTVRPKLPDHAGTLVLWHQDGGYTATPSEADEVSQLRMVNVWSPLVPARRENGCMQFVPGTHRLGVVPHIEKEYYLEVAPEILQQYEPQAIDVEVDPGDVVLFNNLLFHRGLTNLTDNIRWSLDWRYQDATQSTLREENGHLARSRRHPSEAIQSAEQWARTSFI